MEYQIQIEGQSKIVQKKNQAGRIKHGGLQNRHKGEARKLVRVPERDKSVVVGLVQIVVHRKIKIKCVCGKHHFASEHHRKI